MAEETTRFCSGRQRHWASRAGSGTTGISTQGQYRPIECECAKWQFNRKINVAPLNMLIGQPVSLMQQKGLRCTIPSYNLSNPNNICPNGNWIKSWQIIFSFISDIQFIGSFPFQLQYSSNTHLSAKRHGKTRKSTTEMITKNTHFCS